MPGKFERPRNRYAPAAPQEPAPVPPAPQPPRRRPPRKRTNSTGCLIAVVAVLLIFLAVILIIALHNDETLSDPTKGTDDKGGWFFGFGETDPPTDPPEPTGPVVVSTATISVTGDVLPHMPVVNSARTASGDYDFSPMFQYLAPYAEAADYAIANLETTLAGTDNGYKYSGYPCFNCPDEITDALKGAGFDMLLTANNHCYDTRTIGLTRTLEIAAGRGLETLGTMASADAPKYKVVDVEGIQVGMVCYSYSTTGSSGRPAMNGIATGADAEGMINAFDYEYLDKFYAEMESHIAGMEAQGADAIVLYIHWGQEYQLSPNTYQTSMAQKLCDLGVDVIVGGHPHVIQPVELLTSTTDADHKTVCLYSMGNAVSNQRISQMNLKTGHTEDGLLFSFTFAEYSDGEVLLDSVDILPCWVNLDGTYYILPLDQEVDDWKTAYSLDNAELSDAQASYTRTMDLVGAGLEASNAWLETMREAKLTPVSE